MELASSHDLLVWLVDVWEDPARSSKLASGELLLELAVAEGKAPEASLGTMDPFSQWFEDLRAGGWISYDDAEAQKVRFPGAARHRNDVKLSRNYVVTAAAATWVKSSATAASLGQVAVDFSTLIRQAGQVIDQANAPEETKEEARRWLTRAGETALSSAAAELLVRALLSLH